MFSRFFIPLFFIFVSSLPFSLFCCSLWTSLCSLAFVSSLYFFSFVFRCLSFFVFIWPFYALLFSRTILSCLRYQYPHNSPHDVEKPNRTLVTFLGKICLPKRGKNKTPNIKGKPPYLSASPASFLFAAPDLLRVLRQRVLTVQAVQRYGRHHIRRWTLGQRLPRVRYPYILQVTSRYPWAVVGWSAKRCIFYMN